MEKRCLICGQEQKSHQYICDFCYSGLIPVKKQLEKNLNFVDKAYSCFYYNEILRKAMNDFKFRNKRYFYKMFAEFITDRIFELSLHRDVDFLIPVPLYEKAEKKRGYNQTVLISRYVSENTKIKMSENLVKIRNTKEQALLSESERRKNLENSFEIKNIEEIRNKNILILDDVITTGTTVDKCAEKLFPYAKKIYAISVATPD